MSFVKLMHTYIKRKNVERIVCKKSGALRSINRVDTRYM
jgi:hypothetical protein